MWWASRSRAGRCAGRPVGDSRRHSVSEEMYVYPAMREHLPDGEKLVEHDTQEHKRLEEAMKQLEAVQASEPRFDALVRELTEKLRHHAHDEETEQFPLLRDRMPREKLVELRQKVDSAKKLAPTRPHPGAPHSELFHKVVGPRVGLVDRLRDKLTNRPHFGLDEVKDRVIEYLAVRRRRADRSLGVVGGRRSGAVLGVSDGTDAARPVPRARPVH
jgi:Hemerythrin HHE cation binding domain